MIYKFADEIHYFQNFVRNNINLIGNLTIISEQVCLNNGENYIDMLCFDHDDSRLVILELKNNFTKKEVISQVLEYYDKVIKSIKTDLYSFLNENNYILKNEKPKIKIIVPDFDKKLLNQLSYFDFIEIEVVKLFTKASNGFYETFVERYLPISDNSNSSLKLKKSINSLEDYLGIGVNIEQIELCKKIINFMKMNNKSINVFFYENKISILCGKKIIFHIVFKKNSTFKNIYLNVPDKNIKNINEIMFFNSVINIKPLKNSTKFEINDFPSNLLLNLIIE